MTAEEKSRLACFLDTALDYLDSGYMQKRAAYSFEDDIENLSSLPLAFQIAEEDAPENPLVMVIGASPGLDDNANDPEAQLLDRMLASAGLSRDRNCCIIEEEIIDNASYLEEQIQLLKPGIILCLGKSIAGQIENPDQIQIVATYHPKELLQDGSLKRPAFEDMKKLMLRLIGLDQGYAEEVQELLYKYAASDEDFATRVKEYLA